MGSKNVPSIALLLSINLLFFSMVSANTLTSFTPAEAKCPELHVCASILQPPFKPDHNCCTLIGGLSDLDAAVCLCNVLKLNHGEIASFYLDLLVNLLLNNCRRKTTTYHCQQ